jgi:hypothetical protein
MRATNSSDSGSADSSAIRCRVGAGRSAVESYPCDGIDELTLTVDKVRDPERVVEQEQGDFTPHAAPQNLALEWARAFRAPRFALLLILIVVSTPCLLRDAAVALPRAP